MFRKRKFQLPALNLQEEEQSKTVCLKDPKLPKEIKELVDKGNVEQITLREFSEEQKVSYLVKFKEEDDNEYDTYEMFQYYLAGLENKRRSNGLISSSESRQKLNYSLENNPFHNSFKIVNVQTSD